MVIRNCQSKKARQYNDKGNQGLLWLTVSDYPCHCNVWPSLIDSFWLPLSLYCLAFFDWQFLITIVLSGLLWLTVSTVNQRSPDNTMTRVIRNCQSKKARQYNDKGNQKLSIKEGQTIQWQGLTVSDYPCHCIVWPSLIDSFWLPLSLYCLDFFDWQFLITIVLFGLQAREDNDKGNQKLSIKEGQKIQWQE
jgi:hypothetical protein